MYLDEEYDKKASKGKKATVEKVAKPFGFFGAFHPLQWTCVGVTTILLIAHGGALVAVFASINSAPFYAGFTGQ